MNKNQIKMARLCELIKSQGGLDSETVQSHLKVSRRTFFNYLDALRDMGAEIQYNKVSKRYKLENDFNLMEYYNRCFL